MVVAPENMPTIKGHRRKKLGQFIFRVLGWKFEGELPNEPKLIVAGAPHTSNWDFLIALAVILSFGVKMSVLMKKEAFFWPISKVWNWFGFIPVDRNASTGLVGEAVKHFDSHSKLWVGVTPEGTRSKTKQWKTGFLRIAHQAKVPILLMSIDYPSKTWRFGRVIQTSGDHDKDLAEIQEYFSAFTGRKPHRQG